MSTKNYILNLLNIKDENYNFLYKRSYFPKQKFLNI